MLTQINVENITATTTSVSDDYFIIETANGTRLIQRKDLKLDTQNYNNNTVTAQKIVDNAITPSKIHSDVAGSGLVKNSTTDPLNVSVDNQTIEISSNQLRIKAGALSIDDGSLITTKFHSDIAGPGLLKEELEDPISVDVDNATLTISSNQVVIADGGVVSDKLGEGSVTVTKVNSNVFGPEFDKSTPSTPVTINTDSSLDVFNNNLRVALTGITTDRLADEAVTTSKLGLSAVDTNQVNNDAITIEKLAQTAIDKLVPKYVLLTHEENPGVDGPTINAGDWRKIIVNQEKVDDIGSVNINPDNQIILPAGKYRCNIKLTNFQRLGAQSGPPKIQGRLFNITGSETTVVGTTTIGHDGHAGETLNISDIFIIGEFEITQQTTFEIQARPDHNFSRNSVNYGENNVYTIAEFWQINI